MDVLDLVSGIDHGGMYERGRSAFSSVGEDSSATTFPLISTLLVLSGVIRRRPIDENNRQDDGDVKQPSIQDGDDAAMTTFHRLLLLPAINVNIIIVAVVVLPRCIFSTKKLCRHGKEAGRGEQ